MDAIKLVRRLGLGVSIVAVSACSGGSDGDDAYGSLTLALRDASVQDVAAVWVRLDGVSLHRAGGPAIEIPFPDGAIDVDLLTLTADNTEILLDGAQVPAGFYQQLALHVIAEFDGEYDSKVVLLGGGVEEIWVPSGAQTGLKLVSGVTITANQETSFLIDWDVRMGLADAPGLPGRILRPAWRVIDMTEFGTLTGTIDPSLVMDGTCTNDLTLDSGNAVYVYEQFVGDPDDIGGLTGPTPVATATVSQSPDGIYRYETILSPGAYTVAFTCQSDDDLVEEDDVILFSAPADVTLADGEMKDVSFL